MSSSESPATGGSNAFLSWLKHAFLRPDYVKQGRPKLRGLSRLERRRAKVKYQMQAGRFRTWVYAAALIGFIAIFAFLVWVA